MLAVPLTGPSRYVIPPTYDSVIASPQPGASATFSNPFHSTQATESSENLLSPISLLADHPARNAGKPGLFFVTRGRDNTNIVDGDGRSVIRQAITWQRSEPLTHNTPDHLRALHNFSRIEMMVVQGGRKTILVGVGATDLQALDIGGPSTQDQATPLTSVEVAPEAALRRKRLTPEGFSNLRDVVYLHNGLGEFLRCAISADYTDAFGKGVSTFAKRWGMQYLYVVLEVSFSNQLAYNIDLTLDCRGVISESL